MRSFPLFALSEVARNRKDDPKATEFDYFFSILLRIIGMWDAREPSHLEVPMCTSTSIDELLIEKLRTHLRAEGYSHRVQRWYPTRARQLLEYCDATALAIEGVRSVHVTQFLRRKYQLFRRRHREAPPFQKWRHRYTGAVHMLCCRRLKMDPLMRVMPIEN